MLEHGKYYHIYNRGINSQRIFFEEGDYTHFLDLMSVFLTPVVDVYAYVLMGNHFHFAVRIKDEDEIGYLNPANSNSYPSGQVHLGKIIPPAYLCLM